jgi:hypothetical protein
MNIEERAAAMADNHKNYKDFSWMDRPSEGVWCLHYTHTRDSDRVERSNGAVIAAEMGKQSSDDVSLEHHTHFAVGWVDGVAVRIYDNEGKVTKAFEKLHQLLSKIEDYPILDEDGYSSLENDELAEEMSQCIKHVGRNFDEEITQEIIDKVDAWLQTNRSEAFYEERWSLKEKAVDEALTALGLTRS